MITYKFSCFYIGGKGNFFIGYIMMEGIILTSNLLNIILNTKYQSLKEYLGGGCKGIKCSRPT